jgi:ribosomal protein S18 acetylase RimI-like enzyme
VIRDARADELESVAAIIEAAYSEYAPAMPGGRWERYIQHATDVRSRLDEAVLIAAELDGRLVGAVTFYPGASRGAGSWPAGWAGIRLLAVHPEARGHGLGRALTQECVHRARALGAPALGLHTTEIMAVARAMYERMGFTRVPEFDFRPGSRQDAQGAPALVAIAYRLDLTTAV